MKRLLTIAALSALTVSSLGCQGGLRSMCRWNRGDACDTCQNGAMYGGQVYDGMVYDGVVDGGIEEVPAGKSSTRE